MKKVKNQYRNRVRTGSVARWVLVGLIMGGFGVGYVYIKNNHVELGVRSGKLREEIGMLSRQIDEAKGWIARMEDRRNLSARLQRADSQLVRFAPSRVIPIRPIEPAAPAELPGSDGSPLPPEAIAGELARNDS